MDENQFHSEKEIIFSYIKVISLKCGFHSEVIIDILWFVKIKVLRKATSNF